MSQNNQQQDNRLLRWLKRLMSRPNNGNNPNAKDPNQDYALWIIRITMTIGLFGMVLVCILFATGNDNYARFKSFAGNLGLSVIIALAAAVTGGILGFIFGVPRSAQNNNTQPAAAAAATVSGDNAPAAAAVQASRPYDTNTNLEQISDWLAKIIVGVGLTQIPQIEQRFNTLANVLARGFECESDCFAILKVYTGAVVIFFVVCGFMAVYLWARIYLLQQLYETDKILNLNKQMRQYKEEAKDTRKKQLLEKIKKFGKQVNKMSNAEESYTSILNIAKPGPVTYLDDGQKGRWGGKSEAGGYKLDAVFNSKSDTDNVYNITLTVTSTTFDPLIGEVYFFLHESYANDMVKMVMAAEGVAKININSYEAFTVGAVCNNGTVKLELDLYQHSNCPVDYKYIDGLETITELRKQLDELNNE